MGVFTRSQGFVDFSLHGSYFYFESRAEFRSEASPIGAECSAVTELWRCRDFVGHFATGNCAGGVETCALILCLAWITLTIIASYFCSGASARAVSVQCCADGRRNIFDLSTWSI